MYDSLGVGYNTYRKADPYLASQLVDLLGLPNGNHILDLGCGTGNYSVKLAESGLKVFGVEPSKLMRQKAEGSHANFSVVQGQADNVPYPNNHFEGAVTTLSIHHWLDLQAGFNEVARVLKPAAPFALFTSLPEQMYGYWLCHYFPKMMKGSAEKMPRIPVIEIALKNAGMQLAEIHNYSVKPDLEDLFLYAGKFNPELYFDKDYRRGISSFHLHVYQDEVERGLEQLRKDIDSGAINEVIASYENELGDYIFIKSVAG